MGLEEPAAAKDFMRWIRSRPVYDEWFTSQQGYTCDATLDWEKHKAWDADPVMRPFHDLPRVGLPGRLCRTAPPGRLRW